MARKPEDQRKRQGEISVRFNKKVFFQYIAPGAFDPSTGDMLPDAVTEEERLASVMDTRRETLMLVFGELKQGSKTVTVRRRVPQGYSRVRITDRTAQKDRLYMVRQVRELKRLTTFILEEVQ